MPCLTSSTMFRVKTAEIGTGETLLFKTISTHSTRFPSLSAMGNVKPIYPGQGPCQGLVTASTRIKEKSNFSLLRTYFLSLSSVSFSLLCSIRALTFSYGISFLSSFFTLLHLNAFITYIIHHITLWIDFLRTRLIFILQRPHLI